MNDVFVRQRLNQLTGLTVYGKKEGISTVVAADEWTALDITDFGQPLYTHTILTAFNINTGMTDAVMRFTVDGVKIFPHTDDVEVLSDVDRFLQFQIQLPIGSDFAVEVYSPTGGTAQLNYLSIIEVDQYDHS